MRRLRAGLGGAEPALPLAVMPGCSRAGRRAGAAGSPQPALAQPWLFSPSARSLVNGTFSEVKDRMFSHLPSLQLL